jgi:3',5'-cyclic-AMP phosphodiesterase
MRFIAIIAIISITSILLSCGAHAPVGHASRFEFAFCSDIHFACNHGDEQLKKNFNAWRKQLESMDFLVVAGDLTCDGAEDEFLQLQELFKSLKKPVYTLPGNHDLLLENVENDLLYRKYFSKGFGSSFLEHRGIGLLFLDLSDGGKASVSVSEATTQWLAKNTAKVSVATPMIVFSHFPLHPSTPEYAVRRSDRIFSILDQKNVIGYFSGHYHAWWSMERGSIPFYTVGTLLPAMNNHDTSDTHGYYKVAVLGNELKVEYVELVDKNSLNEPMRESGDEEEKIEGGEDLFRK